VAFGGGAMSSANSCKLIRRCGSALRHISSPMRCSSFQIITSVELIVSWKEKAFPITKYAYSICAIRILDKDEVYAYEKPILSSEKMLQKDYDIKGSAAKKMWP
jgi:hypothetical protein